MAKVVIAAGGSGGHLYPSQAFAESLTKKKPSTEILFMGGKLALSPYYQKELYPFYDVSCAPIALRPDKVISSLSKVSGGFISSVRQLRRFRPDLVVGFGSYHTFPVLLGARFLKVPMILHEANSIPGKVNRFFAPYAITTGITFASAAGRIPGKVSEASLPLRGGYAPEQVDRQEAYRYFGLNPGRKTFLVFGGSQGAEAINYLIADAIRHIQFRRDEFQVIHFTGGKGMSDRVKKSYADAGVNHFVTDFEARMDFAWAIADASLTRAGAATIAEQVAFEVPGILIPYPTSADGHQQENATYMQQAVGGAIRLDQENLQAEQLAKTIDQLFTDDRKRLIEMRNRIQNHKQHSKKPGEFCDLVCDFLNSLE